MPSPKPKYLSQFLALLALSSASFISMADTRLWVTAAAHDGDFTNVGANTARDGADALCTAENGANGGLANVRALISIDAADEIQDMPVNYGVPTSEQIFRDDGTTEIARHWGHLLGDKGGDNLTAGIIVPIVLVWSNSDRSGVLAGNSCLNGTSNAGGNLGEVGRSDVTNDGSIDTGWVSCDTPSPVYCISWTTAPAAYVPDSGQPTGTVTFSSTGALSGVSIVAANDAARPSNTISPFGKIAYTVTAANGTNVTTRLVFSTALPDNFSLYKVNAAGTLYTVIPPTGNVNGSWVKVDANTIDLTLLEGGTFDTDGAGNGTITDPVVILVAASSTNIPTLSIWGLLLLTSLLGVFGFRYTRK